MEGTRAAHSTQLIEANRQLLALRKRVQAQGQPPEADSSAAEPAGSRRQPACVGFPWENTPPLAVAREANAAVPLPAHLGWGSAPLTAVLRRRQREALPGTSLVPAPSISLGPGISRDAAADPEAPSASAGAIPTTTSPTASAADGQARRSSLQECAAQGAYGQGKWYREGQSLAEIQKNEAFQNILSRDWVKLYPDIGLGMLRQEMTAPGRLWLMLRYLDREGRGVFRVDLAIKLLTEQSSKLRLCGKRQLRNLLNDGKGVFWTRDKAHIWLYSAAKVACALAVTQLTGKPVALPIAAMTSGIGAFRAHLYTAFHSGRTKETPHGERAMPIARDTLASLSGVGGSSQRTYEARVGLEVQANFAVGHLATKERQENQAWAQGQALFEIKDYRGQQGKKGRMYLAWQLPNSYIGQHQHRPKGRQKRINRELKDLVMKGVPGNVEGSTETNRLEKIYFPNGKLAAKAYGRSSKNADGAAPDRDLYWKRHRTGNGRFDLWQQLGD